MTMKSLKYNRTTALSAAVTVQSLLDPTLVSGGLPVATVDFAILQPESQDIRWRDDGTAPTAVVGHLLRAGQFLVVQRGRLALVQVIEVAASATASVTAYTGTSPPFLPDVTTATAPVAVASPPAASVFAGALAGSATQAVTDITGATGITANTVFAGSVSISLTAAQTAALAAAGTARAAVSWVPGTGGTAAVVVAAIDLSFGLGGVTNLTAPHTELTAAVPVLVYVGTTAGKFQVTVTTTGTVTTIGWDVTLSGSSR